MGLRDLTIMLVGAAPDDTEIFALHLRQQGARVLVAYSIREAIAHASPRPIDALVSELCLADGDCRELMARLSARPDFGRMLAVASVDYGEHTWWRAEAYGFARSIYKPFTGEALSTLLCELLPSKGSRPPARSRRPSAQSGVRALNPRLDFAGADPSRRASSLPDARGRSRR